MPNKPKNKQSTGAKRVVLDEKIELSINQIVEEAMKSWKLEYLQEIEGLKAEISETKSSQEFITAKYDDLKLDYDNLILKNKKQEEEINSLQTSSMLIAENEAKEFDKIDALEQYGRRQNLEIVGIPETQGEDTNKLVIEVAKMLNIEVTPDQISTSHRLPTRRTRHENNSTKTFLPPIIVKFVNRDARNKIYANRKLTRDLDCNNFSVYGTKSVFINENLTRPRKKLLWMTKQKAKLADYKYLWTSNGNIFVRKSEETDALAVKTNDDLRLIV